MVKTPAPTATPTPAPTETPTPTPVAQIWISAGEQIIEASKLSARVDLLPQGSIDYLLAYGWAKSLQDAAAGATKAAAAAFVTDGDEFAKMCETINPDSDPDTMRGEYNEESFGLAYAQALRSVRAQRIIDGAMGVRTAGAPRVDTLGKIMRDIAKERISAAARAKAKPMPKGEVLSDLIAKVLAKYESEIREEATRRMESVVHSNEIDELLGL